MKLLDQILNDTFKEFGGKTIRESINNMNKEIDKMNKERNELVEQFRKLNEANKIGA